MHQKPAETARIGFFTLNNDCSAQDRPRDLKLMSLVFRTRRSRVRDVVSVRPAIDLGKPRGVGKLEWGGNGERVGRGRSVYEQPGAKVDEIAPHKRRDSK